jgi:hypothetical protein
MVYAPTKRIHADTIEEVKQRTDILEVISEHVILKKRGKDYVGLCPFHDEKTPSFSVSPTKQLYYCFGCNVGGNAITFLMELNKHSFTEVVMKLAQRYNVPAKLEDGSIASNKILTPLHKKPLPQTLAIPPGELHLVKLSAPATDIPQPEKSHDPKREEVFKTTYVYSLTESGEPQHWVIRTEWKDCSKPKGWDKKFTQCRRAKKGEIISIWENGKKTDKTKVATGGETVWDKGKEPWSAYRIEEAIRAAKNTSDIPVLVVPEGEKGVELLRSVGVAALNPQGWAEDEIRLALLRYKKECPSGVVAVLRDNDEAGTIKANKFQETGHSANVPVIIINPVAIYPDLPEKGDVEEILAALDTPEFVLRLEAEIHEAVAAHHAGSGSGGGGDFGDRDGSALLDQCTERDRKGKIVRHPAFEPLSIKQIEARIEEFIKQGLTGSKLTSQLNRLSAESQWRVTELRKLYQERKAEVEQSEEQAEAKLSLPSLLQSRTLNLTDYLWGDNGVLAQAISGTAKAMPTSSEFLFTTLLPTASALIGTSSRIVVKAKGKYKQPCIIWSAVVARSGQVKTPAQNIILDPLVKLEIEQSQKYQAALEKYEINLANWKKNKNARAEDKPKPPSRKRYLTKDATIESLERIHSENPLGVLVHRDEIAEDFKADNAYRNGKGGDKEKKLDQFNGSPLIIDRKEREIALERSAISRTGSIQWEVLQSLMGDGYDDNGTFARWLFCAAPSPLRFINLLEDDLDTGIDDLLTNLYKRLEKMPEADYLLSLEAKEIFQRWQHELVHRELEETHPGLQVTYPKIEAYTARFALWLHVVNAALAETTPDPTISDHTMSAAVRLAQYYLSQSELVLAANSPQSGLTGVLLKIQKYAQGRPNGIKPGKLKSSIKAARKLDKEEIWSHCHWLADNGYGTLVDGIYRAVTKVDHQLTVAPKGVSATLSVDQKLIMRSTAESTIYQEPSLMVGKVDQLTTSNHSFGDTELNTRELDDSLIRKVNSINASHSEAETSEESAVDSVDQLVDQQLTKVNQGNLTEEAIAPSPTKPNASLEAEVAQPKETAEVLKVGVKRSYSVGDRVYWDNCPPYCERFAPFEITSIDGDYAKLDLINKPVSLAQLRLAL